MASEKAPTAKETLRDLVVGAVADVVAEKATKQERMAAKAAKRAEALDRVSAHLGAFDLWTRPEPTARRPRLTRDDITMTAMRIADSDGFAAVSMRRIAADLGAGTMTLYYYVATKDELLALLVDAVMDEAAIPAGEPMPADWRVALTMIADRTRAALQRHQWILDITEDPVPGPKSVRHFDQTLEAVASLPITLSEKLDIVAVVVEYVFGYCLQQRLNADSRQPELDPEMISYVSGLIESGDYPQLTALTDEYGAGPAWTQIATQMRDPERFHRNLARILDGIEASLQAPVPRATEA
jgi:AcrR family transcriptional regulator